MVPPSWPGGDQRPVDKVKQDVSDVAGVVAPGGDGTGGTGVEAAVEHRKLVEHTLFSRRELLVGPIDDGAEGMVAAIGPAAGGKYAEPVVHALAELADGHTGQPGGREFDGERQAVQRGAQGRYRPGICGLLRGGRVRCARPVQEQLHRGSPGTGRRERPDRPYVLAVDLEAFPAGRQQDDVAGLPQQPLGKDRDGMRDVLAVVQDE